MKWLRQILCFHVPGMIADNFVCLKCGKQFEPYGLASEVRMAIEMLDKEGPMAANKVRRRLAEFIGYD